MSVAGVIVSVGKEHRSGPSNRKESSRVAQIAQAALGGHLDELVIVVDRSERADALPEAATVLLDEGASQAGALRAAVDWCARQGHDALVVATIDPSLSGTDLETDARAWRALASSELGGFVVLTLHHARSKMFRIGQDVWPILPLDGRISSVAESHSEFLTEVRFEARSAPRDDRPSSRRKGQAAIDPSPGASLEPAVSRCSADRVDAPLQASEAASEEDIARVGELLGRSPAGAFSVVVRAADSQPIVIQNAPFLYDGTPMPTRYWLVGRAEREAVGRLESSGAIRHFEGLVDEALLEEAHERYRKQRDGLIDPHYLGPRPSGGVGGTHRGIKCLHAHLAWYLAGGGDPVGRLVAQQLRDEIDGPVAAIDCGTNSTRLLILSRRREVIARTMTITRLGEGVNSSGELGRAAIERTLEALRTVRRELDRFGVVAARATATSAARDAVNREELFEPARAILGFDLELLDGRTEGELTFTGAISALDLHGRRPVVCDVGGGSTELVVGSERSMAIEDAASLDVGCVRVTEAFLHSDPPTDTELAAAERAIAALIAGGSPKSLAPCVAADPSAWTLIGVAGTIATLATLRQGLSSYDSEKTHGTAITLDFLEAQLAMLSKMTVASRQGVPGLEPGRADVIVGGLLVVRAILRHLRKDLLFYSENDILDGLAQTLVRD